MKYKVQSTKYKVQSTKYKVYLIIFCLSLVFFSSCQQNKEESIVEPIEVLNQNNMESHLFAIAQSLAPLSNNSDFKSLLYSEVEKRFDGDDNALIETLIAEGKKNNMDIQAKASRVSINDSDKDILALLDKFVGQKGKKLYPQIYIPSFEILQERNKTVAKGKGEKPVIVVYSDKYEKTPELPGYVANEKGELEKLPFLISEDYAKKHEVWVISLNERSENLGAYFNNSYQRRDNGAGEYMAQLKIYDINAVEHWSAGDLELKMTIVTAKGTKLWDARVGQLQGQDVKLPRSWVSGQKWWLPFIWIFSWYNADHGNFISVQWVEEDSGGEGDLTVSFPLETGGSISYKIGTNNDENMEFRVVHFNESVFQVYQTNYIEWYMDSF